MARTQIYVPQTGIIYPSVSAAAKSLGVDASNIGKVLRGTRTQAGGYNFARVDPGVSPQTLEFINAAIETELTPAKKRRQAQSRKATKQKKAARDKARSKAARELQGSLKEANKLLQEYKKRGLDATSGIIPEIENLKRLVGINKKGGFNAGARNLAKFSQKQLDAIKSALDAQMNRKGFKNLEDAAKKKQATAYQLGVSSEELDNYAEALPALWQILQLAKYTQGKGYDRSLYDAVRKAMQRGTDPARIKSILDGLIEEQTEILDAGGEIEDYSEMISQYVEDLNADTDDADEFEDLWNDDEWIDV